MHQQRFSLQEEKLLRDGGFHSSSASPGDYDTILLHAHPLFLHIEITLNAPLWCFYKLFRMNAEFCYGHIFRQMRINILADGVQYVIQSLSLIHISEPTRRTPISYAV